MRRKKLHVTLLVLSTISFSTIAKAQLYINSAQFFIQSNATVTVQGTLTSNTSIQGGGTVIMAGTTNQSLDMGGNIIPKLQINNAANVTLASNLEVDTTLTFTTGDLLLGTNNLTFGSYANAAIAGSGITTGFVVTNGTGVVTKNALGTTAFVFAVGDSATSTSYLPLSIANAGTVDNYSVNCSPHVYTAGTTGTADTKEVVDASWKVTEAVAGGSNLTMIAKWDTLNELPHLNRTKVGIGYYIPTAGATQGWDLMNSQTTSATNTGAVYSCSRPTVTTVGTFAVGTRPVESPLLIAAKVFLQGCYNTGTANMSNTLGSLGLIPTTEPYSGLPGFTQVGSGGGETTTSTVLANTGASTDIVDWVFIELRRTSDSSVVSTRSVLLQRNGTLVETDGVTPVDMAGNASGNYFISVRHRNHLTVYITNPLTFAKTSANSTYDFTSGLGQAYKGGIGNNQMATVATNVYAMWAGDVNGNNVVRYTGPSNDENALLNTDLGGNKGITTSGYLNGDLNLDGKMRYTGPLNDENVLLNTILNGAKGVTLNQPTF